jgi:hypothetical protein
MYDLDPSKDTWLLDVHFLLAKAWKARAKEMSSWTIDLEIQLLTILQWKQRQVQAK